MEQSPVNWDAFFDECDGDTVIEPVAELFRYYRSNPNYTVWILSGRKGTITTWTKTFQWLADNDLSPCGSNFMADIADHFTMRSEGNYRSDVEVKREMMLYNGLTPENTVAVFDDRNCMVNAWRLWGFHCFQVAEGDF